jgi:excisionase family DNA binding protein
MEDENLKASKARQGSPFLTTKQAAKYLCLSSRTLEKMRMTAHGPRFRKHGRYVRYHINDLDMWSEKDGPASALGERKQG